MKGGNFPHLAAENFLHISFAVRERNGRFVVAGDIHNTYRCCLRHVQHIMLQFAKIQHVTVLFAKYATPDDMLFLQNHLRARRLSSLA